MAIGPLMPDWYELLRVVIETWSNDAALAFMAAVGVEREPQRWVAVVDGGYQEREHWAERW